mmetsp:Transcript_43676/g.100793  ORF Transcript_43676/g.100793 Transcript_43676/m.100793 type:complete len:611 (-) Transcript_43676:26-1858(-)
MMARHRLSAMLDVDIEENEANLADTAAVDTNGVKPTTLSEFFQTANPEKLRASLRSLSSESAEMAAQLQTLLVEEKTFHDEVMRQESEWKAAPKGPAPAPTKSVVKDSTEAIAHSNALNEELESLARYIPLRPTPEERSLLGILEGALYVSEYTDQVDVYHAGNKARRMALQIQEVCAIIAGLVVSNNFDLARKPLMEKSFAENQQFFRAVFEIGRRYKILNPDKLRGSYGKLIHMLQDSVKDEVARAVEFECVADIRTVASMVQSKKRGKELLQDQLLAVATREIYVGNKSREDVDAEVREKNAALQELKQKYSEKAPDGIKPAGDLGELLRGRQKETDVLTQDDVETIVSSISDHFAFQRFNREPCDRMIDFLKRHFSSTAENHWSLEIQRGKGGSCLSHSHRTQYTFVLQSLLLWREIMGNMFTLWFCTEGDLLDPALRYRLMDTGQGLNRTQAAPKVSRMMHAILHKVQNEVGTWVGLSVVHLGDRDVPNALVFIDKYTQVPRILGPLVTTLDKLQQVAVSSPAMGTYIEKEFGGVDNLQMTILQDFFKHGFDGSGDDGGSCVDGRLTSCWNWCSKIEKKKYFPAFLLTGFTGFDGGFESSSGLGG